ncbi:pyruvate dehydrogenase complex dihydrolipoamide acetyltransferase [Maritalea mediterranea]|uniref:Acetyltransferase component of pyruvate dehydrogenase complex n=1 Tax=Maritalea mediterranea TaxID=2909667 RepID=A0ABS9E6P4_9HYPH|nr:pyruvate dehydrogenase complex dihydrolipoamide acetyltransferase [Maritalea mediterranea]MCF4098526.1 pyruvate dehydrogenase complex dihydrolipoamide acetyltransferase [Maritalea mediterranea]
MTINITMPALSPTMEEGNLAKWMVKEGDSVAAGDVIAEIETDKATMEVESIDEGTVGKILVEEGAQNVKVNSVIAVLLEEGESADDIPSDVGADAPSEKKEKAKSEEKSAEKSEAKADEKPAPKEETKPEPKAEKAPAPKKDGNRQFASPLARRLAKENSIDISALSGSGPKGRVVKRDIEKALEEGVPQQAAPAAAQQGAKLATGMSDAQVTALYEDGTYDAVPNDGMRKTIAARLTEAKQTVPHFYLNMDCKLDNLLEARANINAQAKKDENGKPEYKLSVNDFIVKAWAIALQQIPTANATWAGESTLLHHHSDVAVAVAVPGGLFTPVVKKAEQKSLRQISEEVKDFAKRAKSKKLAPHEYQGGSTAVSNLGMFGIKHFSAVINPPHGTILAIGAGEERVVVENGEITVGNFMTVTLSCDHRSVDGALGAEVLGVFKSLIENPVMMLA